MTEQCYVPPNETPAYFGKANGPVRILHLRFRAMFCRMLPPAKPAERICLVEGPGLVRDRQIVWLVSDIPNYPIMRRTPLWRDVGCFAAHPASPTATPATARPADSACRTDHRLHHPHRAHWPHYRRRANCHLASAEFTPTNARTARRTSPFDSVTRITVMTPISTKAASRLRSCRRCSNRFDRRIRACRRHGRRLQGPAMACFCARRTNACSSEERPPVRRLSHTSTYPGL